jgi:hypothetical protein
MGVQRLHCASTRSLVVIVSVRTWRGVVARYTANGSTASVEYREYPGRTHRLLSQSGWEEIADDSLQWADAQVTAAG